MTTRDATVGTGILFYLVSKKKNSNTIPYCGVLVQFSFHGISCCNKINDK